MADKKSAPLPASSGGLMRFFEDETKGFKIDPKIVSIINPLFRAKNKLKRTKQKFNKVNNVISVKQ